MTKAKRDPLAEGARRLEQAARIIKENQLARTRSRVPAPVSEVFSLSPQEAWDRKYQTHCIGPVCYPPLAGTLPPPDGAPVRPQEPARTASIGAAVGKPARRRSWLGRLLLGR